MKQVKIITINDGQEKELRNGDWMYIEEYPRTEVIVAEYLNDGWTLAHVIPVFNPAEQGEGNLTFYRGGMTYIFVKEE